MATKIFMEALSPTMEEGRVVKWNKNEGDVIKNGESLAEVETDKAIMELVARGEGVLRKRLVGEGESRPVGTLLGVIATADEDISSLVAGAGGGAPSQAGASSTAASSPANAAVANTAEAPRTSPVPQMPGQAGQAQAAASAAPPQTPAAPQGNGRQQQPSEQGGPVRSSPLARRLARERGLDLSAITGSGPSGRIIRRDIEGAVAAGGAQQPAAGARPRPAREGDFQDLPLTQIRKTIARRLAESIGPIPTFYLTAEFDLSRATEMRAAMLELGDDFKVSVNDIILKAVATALAQHPEVNAHWLGDKIRMHNRVHLGMAVATNDGLIVPVIFDADQKRMSDISLESRDLARKARERKLTPEQYTGSTFSVSNLGMFGIDQFTAIINPPEVAILAVGTAEDRVEVVDGEFVVRKKLRVTMSCDHRAVDGAVGAEFLRTLRRMIENPLMLVY
jgi:pyruvate dehydrogenase E2 component (dihydrolipoamide acetyltransferase)